MCECKSDQSKDEVRPAVGPAERAQAGNHHGRRRHIPPYMGFWWTSCLTVLVTAIIVAWIPNLISPEPPKGNVEGFVSPAYKKVEEVFRLHLLSSEEKGAALSVFKDGQKVVDIWGGYADIQAWQPWKKSTVANTFALHNVVMSLCLGLLYERELLDYDQPVVHYWPEFAQEGKDHISVRDILSQQVGLNRFGRPISINKLHDEKFIGEHLAAQSLMRSGLQINGNEPATLELFADQLIRRVDKQHRSLKIFFEEEFASKFDIEYYTGLPLAEQHRAARVRGHGFSIVFEVLFAPMELICTLLSYMRANTFLEINSITRLNDPHVRLTPIGAISGFSSARSLAQLYRDALLIDDFSGKPPISPQTWRKMTRVSNVNSPPNWAKRLGLFSNYSLSAAGLIQPSPKGTDMVGYSAFGGQYAYVDKEKNLSIVYLTNFHSIYSSELDPRFRSLLRAVYDNI